MTNSFLKAKSIMVFEYKSYISEKGANDFTPTVAHECNISKSSIVKLTGRDCDEGVEMGVFGVVGCTEIGESSTVVRGWEFDEASAGGPRGCG